MSARIGIAVVMARLLRGKREAERTPVAAPPESVPPLTSMPLVVLETPPMAPAMPAVNAHRETDALDLIGEEGAEVAPGPEAVAEHVRRHKCGYPIGSIGCRNTHGDGAG